MIKRIKRWFKKSKPKQKITSETHMGSHVLTMQIDKTGKMQTNLPQSVVETLNGQTISHICKVMGYIAMIEMQSAGRTLH